MFLRDVEDEAKKRGIGCYTGRKFAPVYYTVRQVLDKLPKRADHRKGIVDKLVYLGGILDKRLGDDYGDDGTLHEFYLSCCDVAINLHREVAARVIKRACDVGMLNCTDSTSYKCLRKHADILDKQSKPRAYTFNRDVYHMLCEMVEGEVAIKPEVVDTTCTYTWRFKSGCMGNRKANNATIIAGLYKTYPLLQEYQDKVAEINKHIEHKQLRMRFEPTVARGRKGYVSKIGIRCTSDICNSKSDERHDILHNELGFNEVHEFDVKSSIYRVAWWVRTGRWEDNDIDYYTVMQPQGCPMERADYKRWAMRLYFAPSFAWCWSKIVNRIDKSRYTDKELETMREYMHRFFDAQRAVTGETLDNEVFFFESMIYIDLTEALIKEGYKVAQVYDCIYADKPVEDACKRLLPIVAGRLYERLGFSPDDDIMLPVINEPVLRPEAPRSAFKEETVQEYIEDVVEQSRSSVATDDSGGIVEPSRSSVATDKHTDDSNDKEEDKENFMKDKEQDIEYTDAMMACLAKMAASPKRKLTESEIEDDKPEIVEDDKPQVSDDVEDEGYTSLDGYMARLGKGSRRLTQEEKESLLDKLDLTPYVPSNQGRRSVCSLGTSIN